MEIFETTSKINSKEDLIRFIRLLRRDLQINKDEWENITLEDYLEAIEAWLNDMTDII